MTIRKIALFFSFLSFPYVYSFAQGNNNPHSKALGNTLYDSGYTEHASSLQLEGDCQLRLHYSNLYLTKELNQYILDGKINIHRSAIGLQYSIFGYRHYMRQTVAISTATQLAQRFIIGCSIYYQNYHYTGMSKKQQNLSTAIDCLLQCKSLRIYGNYLQRLMQQQYTESTRCKLVFGLLQQPIESIQWILEGESINWQRWQIKCAFQYTIKDFCLRLGAFGLPIIPCFGISYHCKQFTFDIADQWNLHIGHTLSFGFNYQLPTIK